ncbi:hypothetical protein FOMPIDRAFT_1019404 [Fomitopsis schrenkii]|uniref:Uncharacterized protein n=1 Tax=Fomitopsis schrenkii TaxID=2126942 RepID=S8DSF5_FOMSC|nr:hypothetical protein FOMPIDRAFT_1020897 [Fomitopsis schrenkii]EPS95582.1 hypothetical protein FOMPIDRAFT_1019404 [Fomitopsis schrenkii]
MAQIPPPDDHALPRQLPQPLVPGPEERLLLARAVGEKIVHPRSLHTLGSDENIIPPTRELPQIPPSPATFYEPPRHFSEPIIPYELPKIFSETIIPHELPKTFGDEVVPTESRVTFGEVVCHGSELRATVSDQVESATRQPPPDDLTISRNMPLPVDEQAVGLALLQPSNAHTDSRPGSGELVVVNSDWPPQTDFEDIFSLLDFQVEAPVGDHPLTPGAIEALNHGFVAGLQSTD